MALIERNEEPINQIIHQYEPSKRLTVFEGVRKTLPVSAFPSFEIEPTSGSTEWPVTRAQRPRFTFNCMLTVVNSNEDYGVEYLATLTTVLAHIMTDPTSLQLAIEDHVKFDPSKGIVTAYMLDSLVDSITYNSIKEGTVRIAEFSWWVMVHEPYPDSKWMGGDDSQQISVTPQTVTFE